MGNCICTIATQVFERVGFFMRKCLFSILSVGPVPTHIAFIMDGNRRYSKKWNLEEGAGHKVGYSALMSMLRYCYELGVKYVTIYAFSIENFRRRPEEVQALMDLLVEKIDELMKKESIINQYGLRIYFIGNLALLTESVRTSARKVMESSAKNTNGVLLICVAYTSSDEIVHAVQESCRSKMKEIEVVNEENQKRDCSMLHAVHGCHEDGLKANRTCNGVEQFVIKLVDVQRNMYMSVAPDPDVLIRSSGETRLSNFLLWQTGTCPLYSPNALWPEIGLRDLVCVILNFQRCHSDVEKKKKQM